MVSHQLVYVTGMLEVILAPSGAGNLAWYPAILAGVPDAPSDPSGGCGRLRSFPGTRHAWPASLTAPSDSSGRLRPPAKYSLGTRQTWPASLTPSEASETFSGAFLSFPRPRKPSAARFDTF